MKYKVEIKKLSFEVEVTPIDSVKPEPIEPPVVTPIPPLPPEPIDPPLAIDFDNLVTNGKGILRLSSEWDNKEVVIESKGMLKPSIEGIIGNNTILTFKDWDSAPYQLFDLSESESFFIRGIRFVCPPNRPIKTGFPNKGLFGWKRDSVKKGKFAVIDCPIIDDKERVTYGLCNYAYSSDSKDNIYLIAKNMNHNGFNFTEIKNPYEGNLWLILQNVTQRNPIIEQPRSHYYSPTRIKVRIKVENGVAKIISNNTFDQILTHWGYSENNVRSILHFDRYAFDILTKNVLDNKTCVLELGELHPGDNLEGFGKVLTKQIKIGGGFDYTFEKNDLPTKINFPEGEFDAFICYKGSALFAEPITINTTFGEDYWESGIVTISDGYGWSWYNQEFSGYIENYQGSGYFRNSGGSGITKGLTIKNSTFEKNPPIATANEPDMPKEAKAFIEWIESL